MGSVPRSSLLTVLFVCLGIPLLAQDAATSESRPGLPIDWSSRHILHSAKESSRVAFTEPRATYHWLLRHHASPGPATAPHPGAGGRKHRTSVDWSFPLGNGTVPGSMFPAKYSFDAGSSTLTAANCTSDYLVYLLNVAGSSSQPNLVRFNNIYAGTGGLCGAAPTVQTAYTINTLDNGGTNPLNGTLQTSPALSLDGKKVAFIETVTGNTRTCPGLGSNSTCSIFHVLTFATSGSNGTWDSINHVYNAVAPGGVNNNASITTLSYSSSTTTYSSPWVDYWGSSDHAYFGDDNGKLYRTTCVFYCATAPALDTGWPISVAAAGVKMSPPVYDAVSNKVFVGGSDGNLYLVDLALCPGTNCTLAGGGLKSITVGSANLFGGVLDAPLVDATFQTVFAFSGDNGSGKGVVVQTDTSFVMTPIVMPMGNVAFFNIYMGAVDDAYYQNTVGGATVGGNIFACGQLGGSGQPDLYWAPFTKNTGNLSTSNPPRMNVAAGKNQNIPGNPGIGCTPLTEFKNGTTDRLFFSQSSLSSKKCTSTSPADGCVMMYDITTPNTTIGNGPIAAVVESAGTSGVIVDNASASGQASSVYFANQGTATCTTGTSTPSYCAVKLTQSAFQ